MSVIGVNIDHSWKLIHTVITMGMRMNTPMMIIAGLRNRADQPRVDATLFRFGARAVLRSVVARSMVVTEDLSESQ